MNKINLRNRTLAKLILFVFIFSGCGYSIKYNLNERDVIIANNPQPLKVQVATFADERNVIEKKRAARKVKGFADAGDYTNDKNFKGKVSESITKMLVEHLNYSDAFSEIVLSPYHSKEINESALNQIAQEGYDAVLVGEIQHFTGYYDHKVGRQILYAVGLGLGIGLPVTFATVSKDDILKGQGDSIEGQIATGLGVALGFYLESLHKRDIERHTRLNVKMIDVQSGDEIWKDAFEVHEKDHTSMPGINSSHRQMELAVGSLRNTVNEMVKSLSKAKLITKKD